MGQMTTTSTARRPRNSQRVAIDLPQPLMEELIRLAVREDRDVLGQARRLIADGLARERAVPEADR